MTQHHFIPQTYLKGFATDDDPLRVYFYDKRIGSGPTKRMIKDVCHQNNLYQLLMDDGSLKDTLEQTFANIAEPAFKQIVTKLLARQPLELKEKSEFAAYISLQIIRTPAMREIYSAMATEIWDRNAKEKFKDLLDDKVRAEFIEKLLRDEGIDASAMGRKDVEEIIDGTNSKIEWTIPKENWIKHTVEVCETIFRAFEMMHWRIYFAPKGSAFITSDNPVGVLLKIGDSREAGTGFLEPNSIRFFPLSKDACLAIYDDLPIGFSFDTTSKKRVNQINTLTAVSSHNILISHSKPLLRKSIERIPEGFNMIDEIKRHHVNEVRMGKYDDL